MQKITKPEALILGLSLTIGTLLTACSSPPSIPSQPSFYKNLSQPETALDAEAAADMISDYRRAKGLPAVKLNPTLMKLAKEQALALAEKDSISHEASGKSFKQRIEASGYNAKAGVENISAGYLTLAEAFSGWRDSPPHNRNMLNRDVSQMGIAAISQPGTKYRVFWALILASPE